jgi:DNA polymerase-3 subunit gamma/tau
VQQTNGSTVVAEEQVLEQPKLEAAWKKFIQLLKDTKNPARQSFELANLIIKNANSFEATAANNLQQKFLELERNKACEFLQKELGIRQLKFFVVLVESGQNLAPVDIPLSSKEQYQKIIEQFPLVKELKERLKLDLDY